MKTLTIRWQRLVDEKGRTCERCGSTEEEVEDAVAKLRKSLGPLGIEVVLRKQALDPQTCAQDVSQSNRIWVGQRPLEDWLHAEVAKSACEFCCEALGDGVECRTVVVGGETYETIPAELIIRAGLLAGSQLLEPPSGGSCCEAAGPIERENPPCCPSSAPCEVQEDR